MRRSPFKALLAALFVALSILSTEASAQTAGQDIKAYRDFLLRMGFEDFSKEMKESLRTKNFLSEEISEEVLRFQAPRYRIYNDAREIAAQLLADMHGEKSNDQKRRRLAELAAKLLATLPLTPPETFPAEIANAPEEEKEAKKLKHAIEVTRQSIQTQTEIILADIIAARFDRARVLEVQQKLAASGDQALTADERIRYEELKQIQKSVARLVQLMYLDAEMGRFSVAALGKALVLGITRHARLEPAKGSQLVAHLKQELEKNGLFYENYVGTELKVRARNGQVETITIENGDIVMERSIGPEANQITSAARPGGIRNFFRAARIALMGSVVGVFVIPGEDARGEDLSTWKRLILTIRRRIADMDVFRRGVSHVGVAQVLVDNETGMKTTRSLDNYPDAKEGGIRVTDILHQFATPAEYMRLMVSRFNPEKFQAYAKRYAAEKGYEAEVWKSHEMDGDKIKKANSIAWKSNISKADFEALHAMPASQAREYMTEINARVVKGMLDYLYKGMAFAYGFSNILGRGYCTFSVFISFLQNTGIDPQPQRDRWNYIARGLHKMGVGDAKDLRVGERILAPAGLTWQKDVVDLDQVQRVDYKKMSEAERMELHFANVVKAQDPELLESLQKIDQFVRAAAPKNIAEDSTTIERIERAIEADRTKRRKEGENRYTQDRSTRGYVGTVTDWVYGGSYRKTTPVNANEILAQKAAVVRSCRAFFAIP